MNTPAVIKRHTWSRHTPLVWALCCTVLTRARDGDLDDDGTGGTVRLWVSDSVCSDGGTFSGCTVVVFPFSTISLARNRRSSPLIHTPSSSRWPVSLPSLVLYSTLTSLAIYAVYTSPTHPPVPNHLPTLIVTPHGAPPAHLPATLTSPLLQVSRQTSSTLTFTQTTCVLPISTLTPLSHPPTEL